MALRQNASVASDHDSIEEEALLGDAFIDQRLSLLTESDSRSLALESLRDSHDLDNTNLRAQGHEAALQRSFSASAAVGLGFGIANSWAGILSIFGQNLIYGGPNAVVFGLLVATAVQWIITLGLSEVLRSTRSQALLSRAQAQVQVVGILAQPGY
ncbi:MAG: hypothetical protein L6R37_002586 [Teloschistes peruensis]|nr:MAG: hypothetical protein L6R37_002586 [Teloschistes peruensis]